MIVYTSADSSRLQYVIKFIESVIGQEIIITTNKELFLQQTSFKINYSTEYIDAQTYRIQPYPILFQRTIEEQTISVSDCRGNACFFQNENDSHGFDVFAAIFYLLSRYEEWLPHEKDIYGRYAHTNSLAYKHHFLTKPLINYWIQDLVSQLGINFPDISLSGDASKPSAFSFIPTYDIDIAYAYNHQPLVKNICGFFKDLVKGDIEKVIERANVYSGAKNDPFDTYSWLDTLHEQYALQPIYFFLLAKKKGIYDKNISPQSAAMQLLVKQHSDKYETGIHPSWQSGDKNILVKEEINSFIRVTQQSCFKSRQHYIRMILPETYHHLIRLGIKEDYSMGYGSINGFRASTASPFYWYDLENEEETSLQIYPFCYMEANSFFEQHLSPEEAGKELQYYHDVTKKVGGQLITIFHNHFVTEQSQWILWREMYAAFLEQNFT